MIISSKTPFRVSLFGGGTDFEEFFKSHGGLIIGGSINKFNHITISKPLIKNEFILDFAKIHKYTNYQKIWHPVINKSIELFKEEPSSSFLEILRHATKLLGEVVFLFYSTPLAFLVQFL